MLAPEHGPSAVDLSSDLIAVLGSSLEEVIETVGADGGWIALRSQSRPRGGMRPRSSGRRPVGRGDALARKSREARGGRAPDGAAGRRGRLAARGSPGVLRSRVRAAGSHQAPATSVFGQRRLPRHGRRRPDRRCYRARPAGARPRAKPTAAGFSSRPRKRSIRASIHRRSRRPSSRRPVASSPHRDRRFSS